MKKIIFISFIITGLLQTISLQSCKKPAEESELITTVEIKLTAGGIPSGTFVWSDPDGDGGNAPLAPDTIFLDSGKLYTAEIRFLDRSKNPESDITSEIRNEGGAHYVCFTAAAGGISITPTDSDGKYPIGLSSEWISAQRGNNSLRIILKHQPSGKNGTCDPGETDADVSYPVFVK